MPSFLVHLGFSKSEARKKKEAENQKEAVTKYRTRNADPSASFEVHAGSSKCRTCKKKYDAYQSIVLNGKRISEKLRLEQDDNGGAKRVLEVSVNVGNILKEAKASFDAEKLREKGIMFHSNSQASWVVEEKFCAAMECCDCATLAYFYIKVATADEGKAFTCYLRRREAKVI